MTGNMVLLADRIMNSDGFDRLYREGMRLVEEAAAYIDGEGRADCVQLSAQIGEVYTSEAMRLTTHLMQLASWLMLQRAMRKGEMPREQVVAEKRRMHLDRLYADISGENSDGSPWASLPERLLQLIQQTRSLHNRLLHVDCDIGSEPIAAFRNANDNPVCEQISLLKTVFVRTTSA